MTQQHEALRLAYVIEGGWDREHGRKAAAELRRLHELSESESRWASEYLQRAVKAEARVEELKSILEQMQDWEAVAAEQTFTISVMKIVLLKALEAMEIEEQALKYLKLPKAEHLNSAITEIKKTLGIK